MRPNIYVLLETDELSEIRGLIPCFPVDGIKNDVFSMLVSLDITDARLRNISQGLLIGVNPVRTLHSSSLALCSSCPINFRLKRNNKKDRSACSLWDRAEGGALTPSPNFFAKVEIN